MAAPSRAQLLEQVFTLLRRRYKLEPRADRLSILESVVYGICHEGTTREQATQALNRFKDGFFDWNEVRVSPIPEIQATLAGLPDPEARAHRIRRFLRQLFIKTYGFTLESLLKKPQKDAVKALQEYEAVAESDYVLATAIRQGLGGHAIPVDEPLLRALARLGLADPSADAAALRASLERSIPKTKGADFADLMEELSHDTCVEGEPDCPRCDLRKICPTALARKAGDKGKAKATAKATPPPEPKHPAKPAAPPPPAAAARPKKAAPGKPTPPRAQLKPPKGKGPRPK